MVGHPHICCLNLTKVDWFNCEYLLSLQFENFHLLQIMLFQIKLSHNLHDMFVSSSVGLALVMLNFVI